MSCRAFCKTLGKKTGLGHGDARSTDRQFLLQNLQQRVKEVRCLNEINQLCNSTQIAMTELLNKAIQIIPSGFSSPERIHLQINSDWGIWGKHPAQAICLQSAFADDSQQFGSLTVWYDPLTPAADAANFLDEEQSLIDHITIQITQVYTRLQSQGRGGTFNLSLSVA